MARPPVRVLIVDDQEIVRSGLKAMLASFPDRISVVGEAASAEAASDVVPQIRPDVVLCDIRLRGRTGLELCRRLVEEDRDRRVVLLTVYDDEQYLYQAMRNGAVGFLLKRIEGDELVRYLELVNDGETVVDPTLGARAAGAAAQVARADVWPGVARGLTRRESEVLALMCSGVSNAAIAQRLLLGQETVKTHARAIYRKLEVSDRAGAVDAAVREGLFA